MHPFDEALQLTSKDNIFYGQTYPKYTNMVGPFGGLTAATLLKALLEHPKRQGDPISLTVNFAAAVKDGGFEIKPKLIRTNRSTQHWFVTLTQANEIVTTATAVFATRRDSWGATDLSFPALPTETEPLPSGMFPSWTQYYDFGFAGGVAQLFSAESTTSETLQTIRDNPPRPLDILSLTAICDVFFPRIFMRIGQFVPVGTVAFTVYFHADAATLAAHGNGEVIGHARAHRFHNSYFDQSAEIWTLDGELIATTTQIVYFKVAS